MNKKTKTHKLFKESPTGVPNNAWRKVVKTGNYDNWMDYQKWVLSQVRPISKLKKGI